MTITDELIDAFLTRKRSDIAQALGIRLQAVTTARIVIRALMAASESQRQSVLQSRPSKQARRAPVFLASADDCSALQARIASGLKIREIAAISGVHETTISLAVRKKTRWTRQNYEAILLAVDRCEAQGTSYRGRHVGTVDCTDATIIPIVNAARALGCQRLAALLGVTRQRASQIIKAPRWGASIHSRMDQLHKAGLLPPSS